MKSSKNDYVPRCADHTTFGGYINNFDYEGYYNSMSNVAKQIVNDWNFDRQCIRNAEIREFVKKNKSVKKK